MPKSGVGSRSAIDRSIATDDRSATESAADLTPRHVLHCLAPKADTGGERSDGHLAMHVSVDSGTKK
jgi:hypothetical protein